MECKICTSCSRTLPTHDYYGHKSACKYCHQARVYARRDQLRSEGKCIECRTPIESGPLCEVCKEVHRNRYHRKQAQYSATSRNRRRRLKMAAMEAYGGAFCACCGTCHVEFLTIDHVEGNGAQHRREMLEEKGWNVSPTSMSGSHLYLWLKDNNYPPGYRVLCFNCNFSMHRFGYCPHQRSG